MAIEIRKSDKSEQPNYNYAFESQFKKKLTLEIGGKQIEYYRFCPPPQKMTSEVPVVLLPGFTENTDLLKKMLKKLYTDGRPVFTLTYPREKLDIKSNGYPQAQNQKIETTLALINEARSFNAYDPDIKMNPQGKIDLVGRSDGGVNATFAASKHPEWIENLLLIDTKLTPPENPISIIGRFVQHATSEGKDIFTHPIAQRYLNHGIRQGVAYVMPHLNLSTKEIVALTKSDIRDELPRLREHGVTIYGVHGSGDAIFPMKSTQKGIAESGSKQKDPEILAKIGLTEKDKKNATPQTLFDGFYSAGSNIDHASIYNNDKYTALISYAIKAAREKSETK